MAAAAKAMMAATKDELGREMLAHLAEGEFGGAQTAADSEIASFYANRSVFITGATGFIGKVLVEKLLRSCCDIKRIYLLIRDKRGKSANERLEELIDSPVFERVRQMAGGRAWVASKLRAIEGDITRARLGVGGPELAEMSREVGVVFNSAATIRFVEPLDVAVRNNIDSVSQLMELCDQLHSLRALVHLSTAYSNCHKRDTIYEILYEPPMRGQTISQAGAQLRRLEEQVHAYPARRSRTSSFIETGEDAGEEAEQVSERARSTCLAQVFARDQDDATGAGCRCTCSGDLLERFSQLALRRSNRPNTYTFTKAIAEAHLCELFSQRPERGLKLAIVRPSIVGGAWREPLVGFVDNFNGPTGAVLALYTGALQAMPGDGELVADVIPVDMVTNCLLAVGWFLADRCRRGPQDAPAAGQVKPDGQVYLFNCVTGFRNPLRWGLFTRTIRQLAYKYPVRSLARLPGSYFVRAGRLFHLFDLLNHRWPAHLVDAFRWAWPGADPRPAASALAAYAKIRAMTQMLAPFTSHQWLLSDANTAALYELLAAPDRRLFEFDVRHIQWSSYIRNYVLGARLYTLREGPHQVTRARRSLQRRLNACRVATLILMLLFYYLFLHGGQLERALVGRLM